MDMAVASALAAALARTAPWHFTTITLPMTQCHVA